MARQGQTCGMAKDLGTGLILRRTSQADMDEVAALNGEVFGNPDSGDPREGIEAWTRDLMCGCHPTFRPDDFFVVEDTDAGKIVSSLNLISQRWRYGGVEFGVGRPELVATLPDYRRRGLVRALFNAIHEVSAERGEMAQAITGIPWFYRQFGYEMGLELHGGRMGYPANVPKLKDGEADPYCLRPAEEADLPFIARLYERGCSRSLYSCIRDEAMWRYELQGRNPKSVCHQELRVIQNAEGKPVGFLAYSRMMWGQTLKASYYELESGTSWLAVTPSVVRYLADTGSGYAREKGGELAGFGFDLGTQHPVYQVMPHSLPCANAPYAWYVRVPDLPGFIRLISPVLEERLTRSAAVGYSGEMKLSFYRDGLRLVWENGSLTAIESWKHGPGDEGHAAFPDLTFLQLLFGYRDLDELDNAFADCMAWHEAVRVVLKIIFPKQGSNVWCWA
ncbi:MAG: GNAT family N-acetyltransferase [Armatimonadetes bacterium]|nr:GNAT family N-acetyltransferase [Armatimonadota bacterium]